MFIRNFKNYCRDKGWIFLKAQWKLRSGLTLKVENDSDWFVFNEIFTNKEYDPVFNIFLPVRSAVPLVIDLGANVGYFSLKVADELLQAGAEDFIIVALEASPANFNLLQKRMSQPLLKHRVKTYLGLAGYREGSSQVFYSKQHYGHSSVAGSTGKAGAAVNYVDVEALAGCNNNRIDLLKCDIEGSEEIFIKTYGKLLHKVDTAVFEFHAGECNVEHCRKMLENTGLVSKGIVKEDSQYQTSVEVFSRH
jgi:FkbM family methyltransferase